MAWCNADQLSDDGPMAKYSAMNDFQIFANLFRYCLLYRGCLLLICKDQLTNVKNRSLRGFHDKFRLQGRQINISDGGKNSNQIYATVGLCI